ncbi:CPBP family intramembrane glutamic endopeptidase [uncultured Pseudodesulfovibrio sp.]|uniref:CPBP family intramembrane glutamic endopeptidase n=1 Tax=uncultured Pseudodesulfovibrio sp. TaxID=2035858 RepID=UPI0029C8C441|nr:CPBP family intramembrane glutamic endopeptidase [uncultured Pseudodesulfovibrio sp.]
MRNQTDTLRIKPLLLFLALTFGATWAVEIPLVSNGMRFDNLTGMSGPALILMAVMWIPGLSALLVTAFVDKMNFAELRDSLRLRLGKSLGAYFLTICLVPMLFAAMYLLSWWLGFGDFAPQIPGTEAGEATLKSVLQIMLPMSIVLGPFINLIFGLGEEIGWRGFMLPRLMPLGKPVAYTVLGILWGIWHGPLILTGFNYPGYPVGGIAMMCLLCFAFGLFLNEMTLHYDSSILAGFIHGAVNAQGYGVWLLLFPNIHPLFGGSVGLTGVAVWLISGMLCTMALKRLGPPLTASQEKDIHTHSPKK